MRHDRSGLPPRGAGAIFFLFWSAKEEPERNRGRGKGTARPALLPRKSPDKVVARPKGFLAAEIKRFPQNLQDGGASMIPPLHEGDGSHLRLFTR